MKPKPAFIINYKDTQLLDTQAAGRWLIVQSGAPAVFSAVKPADNGGLA